MGLSNPKSAFLLQHFTVVFAFLCWIYLCFSLYILC